MKRSTSTSAAAAIRTSSDSDGTEQPKLPTKTLSLLSWNILAPIYAAPAKFSWVSPTHLEWSHRKPLIVSQLLHTNADIVFLQEVQISEWDDLVQNLQVSYKGYIQKMGNQHPVANAILINKHIDGTVIRTESRSRALIAVLKLDRHNNNEETEGDKNASSLDRNEQSSPRYVYLANVHLMGGAGIDKDETRFTQIKSLLKRLQLQTEKDDGTLSDSSSPPTIIIAGDCNMIPNDSLCEMLETGTFPDSGEKEEWKIKAHSTFESKLLPLQNTWKCIPPVYSEKNNPIWCTHASGSFLDYIWISKHVDIVKSFSSPPVMEQNLWHVDLNHLPPDGFSDLWDHPAKYSDVTSATSPTTNEKDEEDMIQAASIHQTSSTSNTKKSLLLLPMPRMPSENHPSDHLPVGVTFCIQ